VRLRPSDAAICSLFGALFKRVVDIPGFQGGSYIEFLTPGVVVMTAVMSAGWNGMGFIADMHRGVLDRVLVSPVWRGALNAGSLLYAVLTIALQVLIIIGIGLAAGASFANGVAAPRSSSSSPACSAGRWRRSPMRSRSWRSSARR